MTTKQTLVHRFPNYVGFDDFFKTMEGILDTGSSAAKEVFQNWPPYNVIKTGDNTYKIQLAVAGFAKTDIDIELEGAVLRVKGDVKQDPNVTYVSKGIAERAFKRTFTLADTIEVKNADIVNGLLEITLENSAKLSEAVKKIKLA